MHLAPATLCCLLLLCRAVHAVDGDNYWGPGGLAEQNERAAKAGEVAAAAAPAVPGAATNWHIDDELQHLVLYCSVSLLPFVAGRRARKGLRICVRFALSCVAGGLLVS